MDKLRVPPNAFYQADCLLLLERLGDNSAKLVYLDPPFFIEQNSSLSKISEINNKQQLDFDEYLDWLSQVINQAYRVTDSMGNIIIHTEPRINSFIRLIAEDLFGKIEFSEIILRRPKRFLNKYKPIDEHETLLVCRKSNESIWNPIYRPLTPYEAVRRFTSSDSRGRFTTLDLMQPEDRPNLQYTWQGFSPPAGHSWKFSTEKMDRLHSEGRIYISDKSKRPYLKSYEDEFAGIPVGTNWDDLQPLTLAFSKEKTGYPGQQSLELMDRVVRFTTNESDVVVDPFLGSGTTLIAAHSLGRQWMGSDIDHLAFETTQKRLESIGAKLSEDYILGDEQALKHYGVMHDSKSKLFINVLHRRNIRFILNEKVHIEETHHYEFKEVKGSNAVGAIENASDEYAVAFLNSEGGGIYWGIRNSDGVVVGVSLTYRQRDDVKKAVDMKLRQIQPSTAPSSWRLGIHQVYEKRKPLTDSFVVELIVPASPNPTILYATGKGDVFVKTNSGKKKLSYTEMIAEIAKRLNSER